MDNGGSARAGVGTTIREETAGTVLRARAFTIALCVAVVLVCASIGAGWAGADLPAWLRLATALLGAALALTALARSARRPMSRDDLDGTTWHEDGASMLLFFALGMLGFAVGAWWAGSEGLWPLGIALLLALGSFAVRVIRKPAPPQPGMPASEADRR